MQEVKQITQEAPADTQRRRLLMLVRASAALMQAHLSRSGGAQGLIVKYLAAQGVVRAEADIQAMSDPATRSLTRCLQRMLRAVTDSGSDDEQFIAEFESAYTELADAFSGSAGEK